MTRDTPMTGRTRQRLAALPPRRELAVILLLGVIGAGLVFLAMRQSWAQVRTAVPAPLPTSVVTDSGQDLVPYADALAVAVLASLAAVLATRGLARRVVGVLLAGLGVGIAAAVATGASAAAALTAAAGNIGPGTGAGTTAGSATEGGSTATSAVPEVAGFHARAVLTAAPWQAMAIVGAVAVVAAGALVIGRAGRLPVMSSRYDSPAGGAATAATRSAATRPAVAGSDERGSDEHDPDERGPDERDSDGVRPDGAELSHGDSASMWESLSRGEDPTSARRRG
jgi:uncharacterized membrane protein (TIGR02234 family)